MLLLWKFIYIYDINEIAVLLTKSLQVSPLFLNHKKLLKINATLSNIYGTTNSKVYVNDVIVCICVFTHVAMLFFFHKIKKGKKKVEMFLSSEKKDTYFNE